MSSGDLGVYRKLIGITLEGCSNDERESDQFESCELDLFTLREETNKKDPLLASYAYGVINRGH